jgi:hypothetical protein
MILLFKLLITGLTLFWFVTYFMDNFDDKRNTIIYKLYLFLFVFLLQVMINIFNNIFGNEKVSLNSIIDTSINNALISVIAYGVYDDLVYNGFFNGLTKHQKTSILVLLIIGFVTSIKLLQMLLSSTN